MSLVPTSTIIWGAEYFPNNLANGGQQSTSYPALYQHGSNLYATLGKVANYNGVDKYTAQFFIEVLKNSSNPWALQDSAHRAQYLNHYKISPGGFIGSWNNTFATVQVGSFLYCFYFTNGVSVTTSFLAVKIFNMATDTWGAEIVSTITASADAPTSTGYSTGTALCAALDKTTGKIYIVSTNNTISVAGFISLRPGYAAFDTVAAGWLTTSAFTIMGNDNTVNADESVSTIACDSTGAVHVIFQSQDFTSNLCTYFYQAINANGTLSPVASTLIVTSGVHGGTGIQISTSRLLITPTELVLPYGDKWRSDLERFTAINVMRAPIPAVGILPTWASAVLLDLSTDPTAPLFDAWVPKL